VAFTTDGVAREQATCHPCSKARRTHSDPLRPAARERLNDALGGCLAVHEALVRFIGAWDLPVDHSDALGLLREVMAQRW
jgi:hypothetical protein